MEDNKIDKDEFDNAIKYFQSIIKNITHIVTK